MRVTMLSLVTLLLQALTVVSLSLSSPNPQAVSLFKRKGGGGGGRSGGSSSGGTTISGGRTGGTGASAPSAGRTGSTSNYGGSTSAGSGVRPAYGAGGAYYGGGAKTPYTAGGTSYRGLSPVGLLPIAGLGIFGGLWLYSAYLYSYPRPYGFYNATTRRNETKPVDCLCQQYSVCGCDDPDDDSFLNSVVGNASYSSLNSSLIRVADVNGTSTILLNGTLPNGTTAAGGTDADDDGEGDSTSAALRLGQHFGWAVIAAAVAGATLSL